MEKETKTWTVKDLERGYRSINFPDYQREPNIWSRAAKQRLIDSMVRRFDIASIYIYMDDEGEIDCVDGRQRLGAIMSFLGQNPIDADNEFEFRILNEIYADDGHPLASMENKTFAEISRLAREDDEARELVQRMEEYPLTIVQLSKSETDREFNLQFARLNLGTIINSGEKLHAMVGELRDMCFGELGQHSFLRETKVPTRRYSREQLAAQIVAQVIAWEKGGTDDVRGYARTRHFDLQRLFKEYTGIGEREGRWIEKLKGVMDGLQQAFGSMGALRNRAMVVSTVMLAYEQEALSERRAMEVAGFVTEFVLCLKWQIGKGFEMDEEYRYLVNFQRHVTQASVEKMAVDGRARVFREGLALWRDEQVLAGDREYDAVGGGREAARERRQGNGQGRL